MTANEIITDVLYLNLVGNAKSLEYRISKHLIEEFKREPEHVLVTYQPKVTKRLDGTLVSIGTMTATVLMDGITYHVVRDYEEEYYRDLILCKYKKV